MRLQTILKLRLKNPVLYHKFNRSLLDISGELQGYEGEQFNRKARLLFASEIEPQIKEVSACINSMKSGFIKGSLASLGGLSASVVTGSAVPFLTALGLSFANGLTESYSGVSQYQNLKKTPAFIWHRMNITNNLRVIQHAWHFWFWSSSVFTVVKLRVVVACFTP